MLLSAVKTTAINDIETFWDWLESRKTKELVSPTSQLSGMRFTHWPDRLKSDEQEPITQ